LRESEESKSGMGEVALQRTTKKKRAEIAESLEEGNM
jgi:hypothetical protein